MDASTPFAQNAEKRLPTIDERENGFPCGPASQPLFNGMFNQLWAELNSVHQAGGVSGSDEDVNTLLLNILALIDAANGGGDVENYILFSQATSRLPIFPEFLTSDGKINVTAPATGTIRLPGGIDFMHRGIEIVSTVEEDFLTDLSKIYHLRWNPVDGFTLNDTVSGTYNPSALSEFDPAFDSDYDDMLIARIVTNSSNVATITNLVNKNRILESVQDDGAMTSNSGANVATRTSVINFDLARTPKVILAPRQVITSGTPNDHDFYLQQNTITRYRTTVTAIRDFATSFSFVATIIA